MAGSLLDRRFFAELATEHRAWLSAFDPQHLANWASKLNGRDEESALAEAGVRRLLQSHGARVEPNESLTGAEKRPDFHCEANGDNFEVEVTHISIEKATEMTGLAENPTINLGDPAINLTEAAVSTNGITINRKVFWACVGKAGQCAGARYPALLAVSTFHYGAAVFCIDKHEVAELLTGVTHIRLNAGKQPGERPQWEVTELVHAAFLKPDSSQGAAFARTSISALLLCSPTCGFGVRRPLAIGVLHPSPARPFNPTLLPQIEFGKVEIDWASRRLRVVWPDGRGG